MECRDRFGTGVLSSGAAVEVGSGTVRCCWVRLATLRYGSTVTACHVGVGPVPVRSGSVRQQRYGQSRVGRARFVPAGCDRATQGVIGQRCFGKSRSAQVRSGEPVGLRYGVLR